MSEVSREMTLDEWCAKLHDSHLVNRQLAKLKALAEASDRTKAVVPCSDLLCVISSHEKGFWQADVFDDPDADVPEWFCTGKKGDDAGAVITMASKAYPGITFEFEQADEDED